MFCNDNITIHSREYDIFKDFSKYRKGRDCSFLAVLPNCKFGLFYQLLAHLDKFHNLYIKYHKIIFLKTMFNFIYRVIY